MALIPFIIDVKGQTELDYVHPPPQTLWDTCCSPDFFTFNYSFRGQSDAGFKNVRSRMQHAPSTYVIRNEPFMVPFLLISKLSEFEYSCDAKNNPPDFN